MRQSSNNRLPPLRSPSNYNSTENGLVQKKIIVNGAQPHSRRTKSLVKQRPTKQNNPSPNPNINFTFAKQ